MCEADTFLKLNLHLLIKQQLIKQVKQKNRRNEIYISIAQ